MQSFHSVYANENFQKVVSGEIAEVDYKN